MTLGTSDGFVEIHVIEQNNLYNKVEKINQGKRLTQS